MREVEETEMGSRAPYPFKGMRHSPNFLPLSPTSWGSTDIFQTISNSIKQGVLFSWIFLVVFVFVLILQLLDKLLLPGWTYTFHLFLYSWEVRKALVRATTDSIVNAKMRLYLSEWHFKCFLFVFWVFCGQIHSPFPLLFQPLVSCLISSPFPLRLHKYSRKYASNVFMASCYIWIFNPSRIRNRNLTLSHFKRLAICPNYLLKKAYTCSLIWKVIFSSVKRLYSFRLTRRFPIVFHWILASGFTV